jgi:hypothetical protein
VPNVEPDVPEHIQDHFTQFRGERGVPPILAQEHNVNVRMRRQFTPPVSTESDDCEPSAVGEIYAGGSEFFFDRRAGDAFDQQVNYQTPRPNYLLSAYSESVPQAQSLRLYFQEFFERGETLRRIRLTLDLTQFLARVTLNCDQINLHLIYAPPTLRFSKQGAKAAKAPIKLPQGPCLLAFAAFTPLQGAVLKATRIRQKRNLEGMITHFCTTRV